MREVNGKILYVVADGRPGGGTTHVLQLVKHFVQQYDVAIATDQDSHLAKSAALMGAKIFHINYFNSKIIIKNIRDTYIALRQFQPDIVHAHGSRAGFYMAVASKLSKRKMSVYTNHGLHFVNAGGVRRYLGKLAERMTTSTSLFVVYVSKADMKVARKMGLAPSKKIKIIYNGVELQPQTVRKVAKWDVGFIGRLEYPKDPLLFIETIKKARINNAVIVGDGDLRSAVQNSIKKNNLENKVDFIGEVHRDQVFDILAKLRVVVMTSRWEGLPLLPLEAISIGTPVVATSVGGLPEIIVDGAGGILVERDSNQIRSAIEKLLRDPALRQQLVENGKKRIRTEFSIDNMIYKINMIYYSIIKGDDRNNVRL